MNLRRHSDVMSVERRRVVVRATDVLVVNGYELDAAILLGLLNPDKRVLWGFVRGPEGSIQPVSYSERQLIWIAESDLERKDEGGQHA